MLSVEKCQEYLKNVNLSRERVEEIRNHLYAICEEIIKNNTEKIGSATPIAIATSHE
jgi:hypothetical protein